MARLLDILHIKSSQPELYLQALRHKSVYDSSYQNNERLEFLGDTILDSVVAEVLYKRFPQAKEGFLTQIKSRIVSRSNLNRIGIAIGLDDLLEVQMANEIRTTSLSGNALEALIGAIYLDRGYPYCKKFIYKRIINPYVDIEKLEGRIISYKSVLIEWCQKEKKIFR